MKKSDVVLTNVISQLSHRHLPLTIKALAVISLLTVAWSQHAIAAAKNVAGEWGPIIQWPEIAISAATLPDGRVLTWSSTETDSFPTNREFTHASVFDPTTETFVSANSNFHDMFCAGISTLEDGTIVASGGNPDDNRTSAFNLDTLRWTPLANMNDRRWYGTNITMPNNQIWSTFAMTSGDRSELYTPETNTWTRTPHASMRTLLNEQNAINASPSPNNNSNLEWFGHMAVTPKGKVFHGGPTPTWHLFDPVGGAGNQQLGQPIGDIARMYGNVVTYDAGKVMLIGGYDKRSRTPVVTSNAVLVDLNGAAPVITRAAPMNYARGFSNTVTMPNGELLVVGGNTASRIFSDAGSVLPAEIYSPETNTWRVVDSIAVPRNYHSIAILLKDGRVLSAGGGGCGSSCNTNHLDGQIYSPPYLFNADGSEARRPTLSTVANSAHAGDTLTVTAGNGAQRFSMVRLSGTTHHVNTDQRYLPVSSNDNGDGTFTLSLHANPNVLIPGNYWLFAVNANGTPSIGVTINITRKPITTGFSVIGDANVINQQTGEYRITPAANGQLGALGSNFEIDFAQSFTIESELYFGNKDSNGADGIALSLHADPRDARAISALGGPGLGAWGLQNGIALEFDTYQNGGTINDPGQDHFAIWDTDTGVPTVAGNPGTAAMNQLLNPVALGNIEDGRWHSLKLDWNANTTTLTVVFDNNVLASFSDKALSSTYFANASKVRASFTGATGALNNEQRMRNFALTYGPSEEQPDRPRNVALGKSVTQSSIVYGGVPSRAVNGVTSGQFRQNEITHTDNELNAWWEVDLGEVYDLSSMQLWNRQDCCIERLANFQIFVSDTPFTSKDINVTRAQSGVTAISQGSALARQQSYELNRSGRYIRIQMTSTGILSLAEVVVMGKPNTTIKTQERIDINNADFEAQPLNNWGYTRGNIQDWEVSGSLVGVWRPADDVQGNTPNTAYLDRAGSVSQTLSAVLENNTDLSMAFKIGGGGFQANGRSSWAVRLYAGDTVLGEVGNNDVDPNGRARTPAKLELSKAQLQAFSAQYGQPLKIEFTESGDPGYTYFDDVSLVRTRYVSNETDTDGDGVPDSQDAFPNDPNESIDSDSDGVGNNSDAFPNDASETADTDGDGVGDNSDPFPNDPNRDGTIAALPEYPRHSATLIVEEFNGRERVWNVNPDNNTVSVSNASGVKIAEIAVGEKPWALAKSTFLERIYVTNKHSANISVISAETLQLVQTVALPERSQPHGIVFNAQGNHYYVVLEALAQIQKRNATNNSLEATLNVKGTPRHLAMAYDDTQLLVSNFITPFVDGEDSDNVNIGNGFAQVFAINPSSMTLNDTYEIPFDAAPMSESRGPGLPNYLAAPAISYDSSVAYVPGKKDNIIAGTLRGNPGMTFDQTVRAHTSTITLADGTVKVGLDHDNASVASGAAFSGDNRYLAVTLETSRQLLIYDVDAGFEFMRLDTGRAPQSVAFSKDSTIAFVHNFTDRSISRFDLTESFRTGLPVNTPTSSTDIVSSERLSANVLMGKKLFYDAADSRLARDSYMSCASCHKEGKHDGRVWDMTQFGEGLRNTTSLLGKGNPAHGMFHWTGNFDEIQDFEAQIRGMAGGTGLMRDADFNNGTRNQPLGDAKAGISADLDALAAYLASLDVQEVSPLRETALSQQGASLFKDKGCAGCHSGVMATDSQSQARHAVGTTKLSSGSRLNAVLDGFDTPSLHGLFASAPYLHDGSAATVQEAILAHNQTAVTRQEADAIAAYLLQLDEHSFAQPTGPTINVALGKVVAQSSLAWGGLVERAVDGNTSGNWRNGEITHTDLEMNPWLELDLGAIYDLSSIRLWNRTDCCIERLTDFEIFVSDKPFTSKSPEQTRAQASVTTIANNELVRVQKTFAIERKARYVRVQITGQGVLSLAELEVMGRALQ